MSKELLVMGPDCGTKRSSTMFRWRLPMWFAAATLVWCVLPVPVRRRFLLSISWAAAFQLLGTGGRDLKSEIGGIMMKFCLNALIEDPKTEIIGLVSKPPRLEVEAEILRLPPMPVSLLWFALLAAMWKRSRRLACTRLYLWKMRPISWLSSPRVRT